MQESCNNLWKKISNNYNAVKDSDDNHNNSNMTDPNMIQRIFIRNNNQNCNNANNESTEESLKDNLLADLGANNIFKHLFVLISIQLTCV